MLFVGVVVVVVVVVETVIFTTDETGDDITYVVVVGIHDVVDYTDDDFSFLNGMYHHASAFLMECINMPQLSKWNVSPCVSFLNGMYHHASAFYEISCLNIRRNTI